MTIVNSTCRVVPDSILHLIPTDFYLGGSRRMAQLQQQKDPQFITCPQIVIDAVATDYDFYTTMNDNTVATLQNNGFDISATSSDYFDDEAELILFNNNIQVVMRKDANFYRNVFERIEPWFFYQYLWKSSPAMTERSQLFEIRRIFNQLFAIRRNMGEIK